MPCVADTVTGEETMGKPDLTVQPSPPTLRQIFYSSFKISMFSVGGGMTAWMFREYVIRLRWINESDFLSEMAVARVLPGTNVTNMTVIMGYKLLGAKGSAAGLIGLVVGPFCLLMLLLRFYDQMEGPVLDALLQGAAAGAVGPAAYITYRGARHGSKRWHGGLVLVAVAAAAVLKVPIIVIAIIALPVSIGLTWAFWKP